MESRAIRIDAYHLIHDGALAMGRAERVGMRIDVDYCKRKDAQLTRKIETLSTKLLKTDLLQLWKKTFLGKMNINSSDQLQRILYKEMELTPLKTTKSGKGSTDNEALTGLGLPELDTILRIRKLKKIRDTYLSGFYREQVRGTMHPFWNLHTVKTYRSSCDSPNLQNVPIRDKEAKEICRRAMYPRSGNQILAVDYSGIEVGIATTYHKDPVMLKYLHDPTSDMHGDMAAQIFMLDDFNKKKHPVHNMLRKGTKNGFIFPQFYGDYYGNNANSLALTWCNLTKGSWDSGQGPLLPNGLYITDHFARHGIHGYDDFEDHIKKIENDFWNKRFKVYKQWKEDWLEAYKRKGYFDMHTGFRCSGTLQPNEITNWPVQGSAFHCLLWSFIELDKRLTNFKSKLFGQIHDEVLIDVYPPELKDVSEIIKEVTTHELPKAWKWINVPMEVEADLTPIDGSWNEKEKYLL